MRNRLLSGARFSGDEATECGVDSLQRDLLNDMSFGTNSKKGPPSQH